MSDMFGVGLGMGLANAGIQVAGQMAQERRGKKIASKQKEMMKRQRAFQLEDLRQQGLETNRQHNLAGSGINAEAAGAGDETSANFFSSNRDYQQNENEAERSRRLAALERQKAFMTSQWRDEDKIMKVQRKMARLQKYLDYTNQFLQGGASGLMSDINRQGSGGGE